MPENVTVDIGGVSKTITVPVGTDSYDIPRDLKTMASQTLEAIRDKPVPQAVSPTRTFLHTLHGDTAVNLGEAGYTKIQDIITIPDWGDKALVVLKAQVIGTVTNVGGNESAGGPRLRMRFTREDNQDHTGYSDHLVGSLSSVNNSEFIVSHVWMLEGFANGRYGAYVDRTAYWNYNIRHWQFGVQAIERRSSATGRLDIPAAGETFFKSLPSDISVADPTGWTDLDGVHHQYYAEPLPLSYEGKSLT
jgi:hypothetical protein